MNRRETGILGEKLARDNLEKRGYQVLETNYRCPHGEIDIVATHRHHLVFVEVRTKRSREYGSPEESVSRTKQKRIARIARYYLKQKRITKTPCSFDVISILIKDTKPQVDILENTFTLNEILSRKEW